MTDHPRHKDADLTFGRYLLRRAHLLAVPAVLFLAAIALATVALIHGFGGPELVEHASAYAGVCALAGIAVDRVTDRATNRSRQHRS